MNQPQVRKGGILVAVASAIIYSGVSVLAKFAYRYNLSPLQLLKERYPRQHHPGRDHRAPELAPAVPAQLA